MHGSHLEAIAALAAAGGVCDGDDMAARKSQRGGAREGAGRPALPKSERGVPMTYYLDPDVVEWLRKRAGAEDSSASGILNGILRRSMQRSR